MPAFPHHDFFANATMLYTGVYNLLAVPAGVVPVTTVRKDEESGYADDVVPRENVAATLWRANRHSVGLPIGVQLVGPWWKDGRVLHAMKSLEAELQARVPSADGTPPPWKRTDLG
jgi:Asp-tRNA(Asn)/Glu-tRNA(Gln) amidotransferase A subunit family amidase